MTEWIDKHVPEFVSQSTHIMRHYAGCSRSARDVSVFMRRCVTELRRAFSKDFGAELASARSNHTLDCQAIHGWFLR